MSAATLDNVAKLYVATFNRAPDSAGLDYWANCGMSLEDIAQSFFDQPETQTTYPSGTTTTAFVTSVYQNLFNRAPDQAGLDYWAHELDTDSVSNQNFILAVTNGALGSDATILTNKATVGLSFANAGLDDVELARSIMAHVDDTDASITDAEDLITQNTPTNTNSINNTGFYFTSEWLSGRTVYEITGQESGWGDGGDRHLLNDITAMTFNTDGTLTEIQGDQTMTENWTIDSNHTIIVSGGDSTWYMRASGEEVGTNAYVVYSTDMAYSTYQTNAFFTPEAIATDLATAQSLIGTILPAQNLFATF